MKSERRHELQHNQLADWIAKTTTNVAPYKNLILGISLLVVVAIVVIIWQVRQSRAHTDESWEQFYTAMSGSGGQPNLAALQDVIDRYPKTQVAHCAALASADRNLTIGCNRLFENRATARQELKKAVEHYTLVLADCRNATMREQAVFGLARAQEALGELPEAKQRYEEYLKMRLVQAGFKGSLDDAKPKIQEAEIAGQQWPEGAYVKSALLRLKDLDRQATKDFYAQFAKFDPKPAFSPESGVPGKRPSTELPEPGESLLSPGGGLTLPRGERPGGDSLLLPGPGVKPSATDKTKTAIEPDEPKPSPEPDAKKTAEEPDAKKTAEDAAKNE